MAALAVPNGGQTGTATTAAVAVVAATAEEWNRTESVVDFRQFPPPPSHISPLWLVPLCSSIANWYAWLPIASFALEFSFLFPARCCWGQPGYAARMLWHFCVKINENLFALCYWAATEAEAGWSSSCSSDFLLGFVLRYVPFVTLRCVSFVRFVSRFAQKLFSTCIYLLKHATHPYPSS